MKSETIIASSILAVAILALAGVLLFKPMLSVLGAAPAGQVPKLQIATTTALTAQATSTVLAATAFCNSRIVTTLASPVMLTFDAVPAAGNVGTSTQSGQIGHLQGASTTVAYDAALYGCGQLTALPFANTTIIVSQF
jgi:hypothetical protein